LLWSKRQKRKSNSMSDWSNGGERLHIGIDGWQLARGMNGPGRYIFELCRRLDSLLPHANFFIYSPSPFKMPVISERWTARVDNGPRLFRAKRSFWSKLREPSLARGDGIDVFWAEAPFLPLLPRRIQTVTTVYDLRHEIIPQQMPRLSRYFYRAFFNRDLARATSIVAISHGSAKRLREITGFKPQAVVRSGVADAFSRRSRAEIEGVLAEYGIRQPYFLTVTSWLPNKNSELLTSTFVGLKTQGLLTDYLLVIVGDGPGRNPFVAKLVGSAYESQIAVLGCVPDSQLAAFYSGAKAFALPSSYEGFGIPVAEARSCGATVVTSDTPELREAGGEQAIYVKPDERGIRAGLLEATTRQVAASRDPLSWTWEQEAAKLAVLLRSSR
jgi:glycosyltransferase involved in cell wall biosynthesis